MSGIGFGRVLGIFRVGVSGSHGDVVSCVQVGVMRCSHCSLPRLVQAAGSAKQVFPVACAVLADAAVRVSRGGTAALSAMRRPCTGRERGALSVVLWPPCRTLVQGRLRRVVCAAGAVELAPAMQPRIQHTVPAHIGGAATCMRSSSPAETQVVRICKIVVYPCTEQCALPAACAP